MSSKPAFHALVVERGADRAVFLQFEVAIAGIADAHRRLEGITPRSALSTHVDAVLHQAEAWRFLFLPGSVAKRSGTP